MQKKKVESPGCPPDPGKPSYKPETPESTDEGLVSSGAHTTPCHVSIEPERGNKPFPFQGRCVDRALGDSPTWAPHSHWQREPAVRQESSWEDPLLRSPHVQVVYYLPEHVSRWSCQTLYSRPCGEPWTPRRSFIFQTSIPGCSVGPL